MAEKNNCNVNPADVENLFPWNHEPENRLTPLKCQKPDDFENIRKDPIRSIGYLTELISSHINNPENLNRESLKELIANHKIKVSGVGFSEKDAQGERPVIYIKYAGMKPQQDFALNNSTDYNLHNGTESFYCKWIMGFTVYVVSEQYTESLALAEEVRCFLHYFQLPIKKSLCWEKLQVVEAQPPAYDETFESYTSLIQCTAVFEDAWELQEAAPLFKMATIHNL